MLMELGGEASFAAYQPNGWHVAKGWAVTPSTKRPLDTVVPKCISKPVAEEVQLTSLLIITDNFETNRSCQKPSGF